MKRMIILLAAITFLIYQPLFAQKNKKKEVEEPAKTATTQTTVVPKGYALYESVYRQAMKYYDFGVATNALYHMIQLNPNDDSLMDTLAILYYNQGGYAQCKFVGEEILEKNPDNRTVLEILAISKQALGLIKESLSDYEVLYAKTNDLFHLYKIASLQYGLKRFGECGVSLDKIIASPGAAEQTISINNKNQAPEKVPLHAAAFNMKGVLALELNQPDQAKQMFDKALELAPGFSLATANIEQMNAPKNTTGQ